MLDELIQDVARAIASASIVEDSMRREWLDAALDPAASATELSNGSKCPPG